MRPGVYAWLVRCYQLVLTTYPPGFRLAFADNMTLDFSDALRDAREDARRGAVMQLLVSVAADLAWSVTRQWAGTPVPWLTLGYATTIACVCEGLASATMRNQFDPWVVVALLPLVSAITYTCWFLVPDIRRRRDRPTCLTSGA
jgi:hypothetical protein